jgi:hypothetical protein
VVLLVIFGAGASYDSAPDFWPPSQGPLEEDRLPLANGLFDLRPIFVEAADGFPDCKAVLPRLRAKDVSVEAALARVRDEGANWPPALQELAAVQYYLHMALWRCEDAWQNRHHGVTNYVALLREISKWRDGASQPVCFVTFNYDRMLERAMEQVLKLQPRTLDVYAHRNYTLIKLHGSVDWGREIDGIDDPRIFHTYPIQRLIAEAAALKISSRYRAVTTFPMRIAGDRLVFPALSIPLERKDEFNCPDEHVQQLEQFLPEVTRILTIGWRGAEHRFMSMLRHGLKDTPKLMIVSGRDEDALVTARAFGLGKRGESVFGEPFVHPLYIAINSGFTNLVLNERAQLEEFLRTGRLLPRRSQY